ncbi:hypothetical protein [Pontibacter vulgaris]|uniref:hypothetical protein n=1 Tax=Pontibacter vulgaris TaxID=2905679 RepID=UPI001FA6BC7A|nr:hypothetical protein [Pontibacter vulgaris]
MATGTSIDALLNTKQKKLAFFQNLILAAISDGELGEQERDFMLMVGDQLGLTEEDTRPITDNIGILSFIIPEDGMQRTIELQTLVMMVVQDGIIEEKEYTMCLEYAHRIGYGKEILDDMLKQLGASQS